MRRFQILTVLIFATIPSFAETLTIELTEKTPSVDWAYLTENDRLTIEIGSGFGKITMESGFPFIGEYFEDGTIHEIVAPLNVIPATTENSVRWEGIYEFPSGATGSFFQTFDNVSAAKGYSFSAPLGEIVNSTGSVCIADVSFAIDLNGGSLQIDGVKIGQPTGVIQTQNPIYLLNSSGINVGCIQYAYGIQSGTDAIVRATTVLDLDQGIIAYVFDNWQDINWIDPTVTVDYSSTFYDTYTNGEQPTTNYSSYNYVYFRSDSANLYPYWQVDFRGAFSGMGINPDEIEIVSATFTTFTRYGSDSTHYVKLVQPVSVWNATAITHNTKPSNAGNFAQASLSSASGAMNQFSGNFKNVVSSYVYGTSDWKHGWTFESVSGANSSNWYGVSLENGGVNYRPKVEIEYVTRAIIETIISEGNLQSVQQQGKTKWLPYLIVAKEGVSATTLESYVDPYYDSIGKERKRNSYSIFKDHSSTATSPVYVLAVSFPEICSDITQWVTFAQWFAGAFQVRSGSWDINLIEVSSVVVEVTSLTMSEISNGVWNHAQSSNRTWLAPKIDNATQSLTDKIDNATQVLMEIDQGNWDTVKTWVAVENVNRPTPGQFDNNSFEVKSGYPFGRTVRKGNTTFHCIYDYYRNVQIGIYPIDTTPYLQAAAMGISVTPEGDY